MQRCIKTAQMNRTATWSHLQHRHGNCNPINENLQHALMHAGISKTDERPSGVRWKIAKCLEKQDLTIGSSHETSPVGLVFRPTSEPAMGLLPSAMARSKKD